MRNVELHAVSFWRASWALRRAQPSLEVSLLASNQLFDIARSGATTKLKLRARATLRASGVSLNPRPSTDGPEAA